MEKPNYSTDDLYKVMRDCWLSEPGLRPTFSELVEKMSEELHEGEKQHYLSLSEPLELENAAKEAKYSALVHKRNEDDGVATDNVPDKRYSHYYITFFFCLLVYKRLHD